MRKMFYFLLLPLLAMASGGSRAQAQIVGTISADVPFPFYVAGTKLPAGRYTVREEDPTKPSDLDMLEISNAKGDTSAVFLTVAAQGGSALPTAELVFKQDQNHYFLSKIFDPDDKYGAQITHTGYEKMYHADNQHGDIKTVQAVHNRTLDSR